MKLQREQSEHRVRHAFAADAHETASCGRSGQMPLLAVVQFELVSTASVLAQKPRRLLSHPPIRITAADGSNMVAGPSGARGQDVLVIVACKERYLAIFAAARTAVLT